MEEEESEMKRKTPIERDDINTKNEKDGQD